MTDTGSPTGSVRRLVVVTTIGSFSIAALMGVAALLGAGDFGDNEVRVLLTTLVVGLTSVAVLCYLSTADSPYEAVGVVGGVVVLVPLLTSLWLIWQSWDGGDEPVAVWKAFGVGVVAAATLAQASLLLAAAGGRDNLRALLYPTLGLAVVLAFLISGVILSPADDDALWRSIGVVAILDVLGTVVAMAVAVLGGVAARAERSVSATSPGRAVRLPAHVAAALDERARVSGRGRDDLAAEAVVRYLAVASAEPRDRS